MRHNFDEIINRRVSECKKYEAACYPEDVLPMWIADTDFAVPAEISEAIQQRAKHPCFGYPIESFEFEEAAARWERVRFGWNVDPHWVKYANGVLPFLMYAIRAYSYPGDKVVIQPPVYPPFSAIVRNNGRQLLENRLVQDESGKYQIDFDDLEKKLKDPRTKLFFMSNPHNPAMRCFTLEELKRIGELVLTALSQNIKLAAIIQPSSEKKPDKIRKLVDIQANVAAGKGIGYERWAKKFNLKRWSQTLCLLQEKKLLSEDALHQRIAELQTQHDDALAVVKDMDARVVSLKELRGHLVVYRQYKPLAQKLQTVRNPAKFKEQHRAELAVYEAACAYFKANGLRTLPDLKKLDAEYQTLSSEKNGFYTRYKKAQIELRELRTAQQNVETFFRKEERSHAVPQQEVK